jgi:hypothetical protein
MSLFINRSDNRILPMLVSDPSDASCGIYGVHVVPEKSSLIYGSAPITNYVYYCEPEGLLAHRPDKDISKTLRSIEQWRDSNQGDYAQVSIQWSGSELKATLPNGATKIFYLNDAE